MAPDFSIKTVKFTFNAFCLLSKLDAITIKKIVLLLAMIPLFTASITVDYLQDAEAAKSKGTRSMKYGAGTAGIVCGNMLCSEVNGKSGNLFVSGENQSKNNL